MSYDLEIVLPICLKSKYQRRFNDFKQYGVINADKRKLLVTLLTESRDASDKSLKEGWPEGVDVQVIDCPLGHEACKTYYYFSRYSRDDVRWIAKFDDDSVNDVDRLVASLDEEFDHTREYYIVTNLQDDINEIEYALLKSMGFGQWFAYSDRDAFVFHEKEGCVISQAAMKRIMETPQAVTLMERRSKIPDGFTDVCLACAARIAKIHAVDARFMSPEPLISEFTVFGGNMSHIHFIAHDVNRHAFNMLKDKLADNKPAEGFSGFNFLVTEEFDGEKFMFVASMVGHSKIHLNPPGENWRDWKFWSLQDKSLVIGNSTGETLFSLTEKTPGLWASTDEKISFSRIA